MSEQPGEKPRIIVDSDWKSEAQREKERLAQQLDEEGDGGPLPPASFMELVNMVLMQAMIGFGGFQTPDGRTIPPDLEVAKHHIDLLGVLADKTKGNLTDDEKKLLDAALYELRMRFVQAVSGPPGAPGAAPGKA